MAASSREERRLMRQRGAGMRQVVNNLDFGIAFPTPVRDPRAIETAAHTDANKENDAADTQAKRKKRKSIGQQSGRKRKRLSRNSLQELAQPAKAEFGDEVVALNKPLTTDGEEVRREADENDLPTALEPRATFPWNRGRQQGQRNPSRKSIQTLRQSVARSNSPEPVAVNGDAIADARPEPMQEASDFEGDAMPPPPQSGETGRRRRKRKSIVQGKKKKRTSIQSFATAMSPRIPIDLEDDENGDETYVDEQASPEPATPAMNHKKPRKMAKAVHARSGLETSSEPRGKRRRRRSGSPSERPMKSGFPITTHRLANTFALPTIAEEIDQNPGYDSEDDLNANRIKFGDRTAPNAVDVLAQICRETVDAALETLREGSHGNRAVLKRKIAALEAFGTELDSRLFDMSTAVENRLTLEVRVKKSKKEKADLQARWIEVRRQRENVALRCDAVRRQHWENEEDGERAWKLSEQLHSVELAMERGQDTETDGLDYMLRSIAAVVSNHDGGGLLNRVKDFNERLERIAGVL